MNKLFKFLLVSASAFAVFFLTNANAQSGDLTLASLTKLNSANAECVSTGDPFRDTGRCSQLSGNCYAMSGSDCDPYGRP